MTPVVFRRELHRHPELSFREERTARFISKALTEAGIDHRPIAGTGILARIEGVGNLKKAVVLRADIDALPIHEAVEVEWRSENEGVMHACGHDIHAAVLYGVLCRLAEHRNFEGTVFGLFQPGEECNPGGASLVLAENPFDGYDVSAVIGEHVEPKLPVGTFGFREGKYMASSDELRFTVNGKGGHAALRADLHDAVVAAAELILRLNAMNSEETILSTGKVVADGATNVIPDNVYIEGTLRTFDESVRRISKEEIEAVAYDIDARHSTSTVVDISQGYPCVVNNEELTATARALAAEHFKSVDLELRPTAEDFGFYTVRYPSLFYRLGVGGSGATHTSEFCPDEEAITAGIEFMHLLTIKLTNQNGKEEK